MPSLITVALTALCCTITAATAQYGSTTEDRPHRDPAIHWPAAFDPATAPLFSHNELLIHADCHRVWTRLTDVTSWPQWFALTKDVTIDGPDKTVHQGTNLHLRIFDSPIQSCITEFVPDSRLSWAPLGSDESEPHHFHTWHLMPESSDCRVVTEETGIGPNDIKGGPAGDNTMHRAHDLLLASLKWTSEQ